MRFGIYIHTQGPSAFREIARDFDRIVGRAVENLTLSEVDGLYLSFQSVSSFETGIKNLKRKVRRNFTSKIITGGTIHYDCCVELDAQVADAEVIEASSEPALFEYVRSLVAQVLPLAYKGFPSDELALLQSAVASASMPHAPRW